MSAGKSRVTALLQYRAGVQLHHTESSPRFWAQPIMPSLADESLVYASPSTFLNFEARGPGEAERVVVASYSVFSLSSPMTPSHSRACNFTNINQGIFLTCYNVMSPLFILTCLIQSIPRVVGCVY